MNILQAIVAAAATTVTVNGAPVKTGNIDKPWLLPEQTKGVVVVPAPRPRPEEHK